jgi:hypothetical protein
MFTLSLPSAIHIYILWDIIAERSKSVSQYSPFSFKYQSASGWKEKFYNFIFGVCALNSLLCRRKQQPKAACVLPMKRCNCDFLIINSNNLYNGNRLSHLNRVNEVRRERPRASSRFSFISSYLYTVNVSFHHLLTISRILSIYNLSQISALFVYQLNCVEKSKLETLKI